VYRWLQRFSAEILDISGDQCCGMPVKETDKCHIEYVMEI